MEGLDEAYQRIDKDFLVTGLTDDLKLPDVYVTRSMDNFLSNLAIPVLVLSQPASLVVNCILPTAEIAELF